MKTAYDHQATRDVLAEVLLERMRQEDMYGGVNDDLLDGTGPDVTWLKPYTRDSAEKVEKMLREDYEYHEEIVGRPTWMHLVREEVAEAFQETDLDRLEEELIQVSALCVSWVERIRARHS